MLLTLTTTKSSATDLGRLLHKHPDRLQRFPLSFGEAIVVYPEASEDRCTAALQVEVTTSGGTDGSPYVSDRPFATGSYLPSAISRVFGTALAGQCASLPDLVTTPIPLVVCVTPVACHGTASPKDLFAPLGWAVTEHPVPLDPTFPEWGSVHQKIVLKGTQTLRDALRHVCVLLPALDGRKHYFVGDDEVEKLLRLGEGWLDGHPRRDAIVRRYLGFQRLVASARQVMSAANQADDAQGDRTGEIDGTPRVPPPHLQEARIAAAVEALAAAGAKRVADIGCGEGDLLAALMADQRFDGVIGVDPSPKALERATRKLRLEKMQPNQRARIDLIQGAATYPDSRLAAYDAYALLEVIEHIDPWRLRALEAAVFGAGRPRTIVMTTPNREWNALIPALADGKLRHADHRFEWTRSELDTWAGGVCERRGYSYTWFAVGPEHPTYGPPSQGIVFKIAVTPDIAA